MTFLLSDLKKCGGGFLVREPLLQKRGGWSRPQRNCVLIIPTYYGPRSSVNTLLVNKSTNEYVKKNFKRWQCLDTSPCI